MGGRIERNFIYDSIAGKTPKGNEFTGEYSRTIVSEFYEQQMQRKGEEGDPEKKIEVEIYFNPFDAIEIEQFCGGTLKREVHFTHSRAGIKSGNITETWHDEKGYIIGIFKAELSEDNVGFKLSFVDKGGNTTLADQNSDNFMGNPISRDSVSQFFSSSYNKSVQRSKKSDHI